MLREELKMIAGIPTEDMDYIGFMLLKDGDFFKEESSEKTVHEFPIDGVPQFDTWFDSL